MSALHEDGLVAPERPSAHDLYFEARRARAAMIAALIGRAAKAIGLGVRALARLCVRPFDLSAPRPAQRAGGSSHHSWDLP
jgi:hypothetical protein